MKTQGKLRVAVMGCGFWSRYQIAGWHETQQAQVVAVYNRTRAKADAVAREFGVPSIYDSPEDLIRSADADVIDIITDVDTHEPFVKLAASHRRNVICQKPMAPTIRQAVDMVAACKAAGVKFFVHENFRHQLPIRELKAVIQSGQIGRVFRARLDFINGFPVFVNQPFLRELPQFILTDVGSHTLDVARFLFGEAQSLYCKAQKIHSDIAGEDVATVMMEMGDACVTCHHAYAENHIEHEVFPQIMFFIEGTKGSIVLGPDYWLRVTTASGTHSRQVKPPRYAWADPAYDVVHASIPACNLDILAELRGERKAETSGEDNLSTMRLVYGAYASAKLRRPIEPACDDWFDASLP